LRSGAKGRSQSREKGESWIENQPVREGKSEAFLKEKKRLMDDRTEKRSTTAAGKGTGRKKRTAEHKI